MCWDCYANKGGDPHKDFIRGKNDPDFGEVEVNYAPKKRVKARKYKHRTRPGCPENNYGPHVYVWTTEFEEKDFFSDYFGFPKRQTRRCCGCGKRNGSDYSDQYMKVKERRWAKKKDIERGVPVSRYSGYRRGLIHFRYWQWENEIPEYMAARKEYIAKHGWDRHLYGSLY